MKSYGIRYKMNNKLRTRTKIPIENIICGSLVDVVNTEGALSYSESMCKLMLKAAIL